jgi:hypothetical protein
MIKCSCTSKRRRCRKKSRRKIISSVALHPSVSVPRVAAAGAPPRPFAFDRPLFADLPISVDPPIFVDPPIVAGRQCVGMYLLLFAYLHLEGVGTAPDIVPGLNAVAADIASTKAHQDGGEPGHSFAGLGSVRRLWPFDTAHRSCFLESDV